MSDAGRAGQRVLAARTAAGFSQGRLGALLGCRAQYVSDVEGGRLKPSLEWLHRAAVALGADPHGLDPRLQTTRPAAR